MQRRTAISYSRFSDPKQSDGDSLERQEREFRRFCQAHNLTPLRDAYTDKGRSGFHGEHRAKGDLKRLIDAAKGGAFEPGSVVVVEAWDRLGRLRPDEQTALVAELLKTGVDVGIARLGDIFTESDFGTHKWAGFATFAMLAYQESKQRSDRIASAWTRMRKRAREEGRAIRCPVPAWLTRNGDSFTVIEKKAAAVRRIFELSASGYGQVRIIRALKKEQVAPISGKAWNNSYINSILTDRRVLGELRVTKKGKPEGEPLRGYYPSIVNEDTFALARVAQIARRGKNGKRDRKHVNVFPMLTSATDGEGFYLHPKADGLKLVNVAARNARAVMTTFPYPVFETAILGKLAEISPASILPKEKEHIATVGKLRAKLASIRQDIASLQASLKKGYSKALDAVLRDREAEEEKVASELQDALARSVMPTERAWNELPSLVEAVERHGDEARLKIRTILGSIVEDARLLLVRRGSRLIACVQFFFTGGAVRHYLVVYQVANRGRPQSSSCRSLADLHDPAELDLRRREDAAALEAVLTEMDLTDLESGEGL
jgi:DNA invertase Pin-like site-specific DNA recombinase